jgi:uncharacterized protein
MRTRLRSLGLLLLFGVTLLGAWAFVMNRVLSHWADAPGKTVGQLALIGACATIAGAAWRRRRPWMVWTCAVLLCAFVLGESRRIWLRAEYRATEGDVRNVSLLKPVTTTDLAIERYTAPAKQLARERLRVVQLSDVHAVSALGSAYYARVNEEVRAVRPDLIVLTGDYLSKLERLDILQRWLDDFPRAPLGAFAVLGNHDYWAGRPELVRAALERAGVKVLSATCDTSAGVRVCGTDAPWGPRLAPTALADTTQFTLVLSHTPDNIYEVADTGAAAMFAGHTHGGQLRLPGFGALIVPSSYGRRFDRGHFVVGRTSLFVSPGIGADAPALRLWCRPAIVVVDFVREG